MNRKKEQIKDFFTKGKIDLLCSRYGRLKQLKEWRERERKKRKSENWREREREDKLKLKFSVNETS